MTFHTVTMSTAGRRGRSRAGAVAVTVVMLLVLGACGDDDDETTASQGTQAPTTAAAAPTTRAATPTTAAAAQATVATAQHPEHGTILVDASGRALYTFDRDTSGTSACTGNCATTWPPLMVPASGTPVAGPGVGTLGTVARPDSGTQVTLAGKPLYLYAGDGRPGEVTGDGVGNVWHVAKG